MAARTCQCEDSNTLSYILAVDLWVFKVLQTNTNVIGKSLVTVYTFIEATVGSDGEMMSSMLSSHILSHCKHDVLETTVDTMSFISVHVSLSPIISFKSAEYCECGVLKLI